MSSRVVLRAELLLSQKQVVDLALPETGKGVGQKGWLLCAELDWTGESFQCSVCSR